MRSVCCVLLLIGSTPLFAGSSNSLLDVSADGKSLLCINTDNGSLSVVDLTSKTAAKEIPLGDHPEGVSWIGKGPLAIATVYRDDKVVLIDTVAKKVVQTIPTAAEPYGVIVTADGSTAYVTHDYPGLVSEIDLAKKTVTRTIPAGQWARGIAFSADESRLFVANHYSATLTAIDRSSGKTFDSWPGRESDNLCRHVVVHPKRSKAYLTHLRSRTHIFSARGSIFPELSIVTTSPDKGEKRRVAVSLDTFNGVVVTANPWESAISPDGKMFVTVYAGTNNMNYSSVIDDDYREVERGGLIPTGQHPRAVRFSPDGKTLYVSSTLDYTVEIYTLASGAPRYVSKIKLCEPLQDPQWVRGKELFVLARNPMTRAQWISCSSCHPDGAQDGRVWENPEGHRKTPPLFGLAHTHPLHWSADRDESQDFEYTIRGVLMNGSGLTKGPLMRRDGFAPGAELEEKLSGRSKDLDALAVYTNSFQSKLSPHIPAPGKLSPEAQRGKAHFFDKVVGCATCHSGPYYSDSGLKKPFLLHDVGTGNTPDEKMGPKYDTPTLIGVYRSAPYLHNGTAKTLMDVVTTANPKDLHGKTSHLKKNELEDLVAFLKSLPYEPLPDETPNSVPHRVKFKRPAVSSEFGVRSSE